MAFERFAASANAGCAVHWLCASALAIQSLVAPLINIYRLAVMHFGHCGVWVKLPTYMSSSTQDSESRVTGAVKLAGESQWDKKQRYSVGD